MNHDFILTVYKFKRIEKAKKSKWTKRIEIKLEDSEPLNANKTPKYAENINKPGSILE